MSSGESMPSGELDRLFDLVYGALRLPAEERVAFIRSACADDSELATRVERLVALETASEAFLSEPAAEAAVVLRSLAKREEEEQANTPKSIGRYSVVRRIGRGGMGNVYLARQQLDKVSRDVAVKVIRRGMDTDAVISRFRLERSILASLSHPNIARLLDTGTTDDGRGFCVMEYVDGQPITDYCDTHKLDVEARLELFETVCGASHYAHQNLVVHRDIKPSNILVTREGRVKLLDFGIAKVLDPQSMGYTVPVTGAAQAFLTPDYASPEQLRGETISTATDIYSLGVLLYELLSGHRPFRSASGSQLDFIRRVLDEEPRKPSTSVNRTVTIVHRDGRTDVVDPPELSAMRDTSVRSLREKLAGDLDTIILKAIRKSPAERYSSVEQLREDITRYREGLPIDARPATLGYRARKMYGRHRVAVLSAIVIVLGVVSLTTYYVTRLAKERTLAQQEFRRAESVKNFVVGLFEQGTFKAGISRDEQIQAANTLIEPALEDLDILGDDPGSLASVLNIIGHVLVVNDSEDHALRVLHQADSVGNVGDVSLITRAETWQEIGRTYLDQENSDSAYVYARRAFETRKTELGPLDPKTLESMTYTAWAARGVHDNTDEIERLLPVYEEVFGPRSVELANVLSDSAWRLKDRAQSIAYLERALDIYEETTGLDDPLAATTMSTLGLFVERDDSTRALNLTHRAHLALVTSVGAMHPLTLSVQHNLGAMYADRAMYREADTVLTALDDTYLILKPDRDRPSVSHLFWHGMAKFGVGEYESALEKLRLVLDLLNASHGRYADTLEMYLVSLVGVGRAPEARSQLNAVLPAIREAGRVDEELIRELQKIVGL